jgi:hypothetical protein
MVDTVLGEMEPTHWETEVQGCHFDSRARGIEETQLLRKPLLRQNVNSVNFTPLFNKMLTKIADARRFDR